MSHSCERSEKAEQEILEIYDESYDQGYQAPPFTSDENGYVTGKALCKIRCSSCGEIYLSEVPLLKSIGEEDILDDDSDDDDDDIEEWRD